MILLWQVFQLVFWSVAFAVIFLACLGAIVGPPVWLGILIKRKLT